MYAEERLVGVKSDALPARFVILERFVTLRGDKTCRKVHSLRVLLPLRQQHCNLFFLFSR